MSRIQAVTFDAGQTLIELDPRLLAARLGERGVVVDVAALDAATPAGWAAYDAAVATDAPAPWKVLMDAILAGAGVTAAARPALVDWLWDEQPRQNLWRRSIAGMRELCLELRGAGVRVGVVSNSEGRLAALLDELGWGPCFEVVADSGALGVEKPARGIFDWAFARLGVAAVAAVHVGDSWPADILGARGVGARAIWFGRVDDRALPDGVAAARDAAEVRAALAAWGLLSVA